jgi:predicted Abi (CAAX) family protease
MTKPLFNELGNLISGAFSLTPEAFQKIVSFPGGQTAALLVVLAAGFSLAVGQSIILFTNQVQPLRFVFSLLLNAVLFACGFLFLVSSTWLTGWLPGFTQVPWSTLVKDLGLGYAPLLFSFLAALPYAGVPIFNLLSVWHLLAMVVGFGAIAQVDGAAAWVHVALGWLVLQLLQRTIGQPIAKLGQRLSEQVAGVDLADNRSELAEIIQSGLQTRVAEALSERSLETPNLQDSGSEQLADQSFDAGTATLPAIAPVQMPSVGAAQNLLVRSSHYSRSIPQTIQLGLGLMGMILLFFMITILLHPVQESLFTWHGSIPRLIRQLFDLVWIGVVAMVFAGFLAPLEALGWWAGWYGDGVDTRTPATHTPITPGDRPSRYVVYLDGVGQSGETYTPDVVEFVQALQAALPKDVVFVQGLMMYSVFNQPLDHDRLLSWVWRLADKVRWKNPKSILGLMINLRNAWIVAVSADQRYGPIYNQGIAQILYNGLVQRGYQPSKGVPITLIGYSGGGQMSVAAAPYLKRVLNSEIEVISLGGVMSANNNFLKLAHLYHLVGDRDNVAGLGAILFPGRWQIFALSYWNRAKRKGKISEISLGAMGHQVPGGIMDAKAFLPNGQSNLQHTIALILSILQGRLLVAHSYRPKQISNYDRYQNADFNHYTYYPLSQTVDSQWYRPIAPWMGRLILPLSSERSQVRGVWFEIYHADRGYEWMIGQTVMLRWMNHPAVQARVRTVTRDVHFSADAEYSSQQGGIILPERLNHWQQVDPLESLAGSHPIDDLIVMLEEVEVEESDRPILRIANQPIEITGRYYGLVQFETAIANTDQFQVKHFNPTSRQFDGWTELVRLPEVIRSETGSYPSTTRNLEQTPLNETGWYIYGAKDATGQFVVQAIAPRSLLRLQPNRVVFGENSAHRYIRREAWANIAAQKGKISSVLCAGNHHTEQIQAAIDDWKEGDRALLLHVYGGIGGNQKEPAAATPLFFGHFAYGLATVVRDPLSRELRFEIQYYQVYSQNTDGLTAGTLHWSRYMGDRQWGWLGTRPTCDILVKFEPFTDYLDIHGARQSALSNMVSQLQVMTARYRIGDGTGATYVGAANNCAQDSNHALFDSLRFVFRSIAPSQDLLQTWITNNPSQTQCYQQLLDVKKKLYRKLQPLGAPRTDWETNEFNLGSTLEDEPLHNLWAGLLSWRTLLPRKASDTIVQVFLEQGASVWVLRTNQVGGNDPNIAPIAPMTL